MMRPALNQKPVPELPRKLGRYLLVEQIAESYLSEVYLGGIPGSGIKSKILAIKTLHRKWNNSLSDRKRFFKEMKHSQALVGPNLVKIIEFGEFGDVPFIVMERIAGKTTRDILAYSELPLPFPVAVEIINKTAKGLSVAHGLPQPIIHRDLSPQNVMVSYQGDVKLIDFGIAKVLSNNDETATEAVLGKPAYMSPEQVLGQTPDQRSDIFSLGSLFFELLTAKRAFYGNTDLHVIEKLKDCENYFTGWAGDPTTPDELKEVIRKCLRLNPSERFQRVEEIIHVLDHFAKCFPSSGVNVRSFMQKTYKEEMINDQDHDEEIQLVLGQPMEFTDPNLRSPKLVSSQDEENPFMQTKSTEIEIPKAVRTYTPFVQKTPTEKVPKKPILKKIMVAGLGLFAGLLMIFAAVKLSKSPEASQTEKPWPKNLPLDHFGYAYIDSKPLSRVVIRGNGILWTLKTPQPKLKLPPGLYEVEFKLPLLSKTATFEVKEGRFVIISRNLFFDP